MDGSPNCGSFDPITGYPLRRWLWCFGCQSTTVHAPRASPWDGMLVSSPARGPSTGVVSVMTRRGPPGWVRDAFRTPESSDGDGGEVGKMGASEIAGGSEFVDQATTLAQELGHLRGQVKVLEERLAAADAVEEHLHIELDAARAEAADARADLKECQARAEARTEEWRGRLEDMRHRVEDAEAARRRAEEERATVIAALGRRGRR